MENPKFFPLISIIIRNRNEAEFLPFVLESIRQQRNVLTETIIVDNESEDNSVEIANKFNCRIVNLPKNEFSYGRGINLGMRVASSEICVLLSAHSMLVGPYSLLGCIDAFDDPSIGAARFVNIGKRFDVKRWIEPEMLEGKLDVDTVVSKGLLANGCAIRRSVWEELPFDEEVLAAEEKFWAIELLRMGYKILSLSPVAYCYIKSIPHAARIRKNNRELLTIHARTGAKLGHLRQGFFHKVRKFTFELVTAPIVTFHRTFIQMYLEFIALLSVKDN